MALKCRPSMKVDETGAEIISPGGAFGKVPGRQLSELPAAVPALPQESSTAFLPPGSSTPAPVNWLYVGSIVGP
jgi:hypothetical protein